MTTADYFAIHPGAPLPELSSPAEVTVLSDFAPVELPWFWVVIDRCYHTQSVHDARLVFNANFPQHAIALSHLLADDLENIKQRIVEHNDKMAEKTKAIMT